MSNVKIVDDDEGDKTAELKILHNLDKESNSEDVD